MKEISDDIAANNKRNNENILINAPKLKDKIPQEVIDAVMKTIDSGTIKITKDYKKLQKIVDIYEAAISEVMSNHKGSDPTFITLYEAKIKAREVK